MIEHKSIMSSIPKVTVLMPTYNCVNYVCDAINSILRQTYSNFEFIIIDDNSTDGTVSEIKKIKDSRIKLIQKPQNTGYTHSLNYGISIANGVYIARMDGDDISLPTRLESQVSYMEANQDVVVCGTKFRYIDSNKVRDVKTLHDEIVSDLLKGTAIGHPTAMIRTSILKNYGIYYDVNKEPAEDYDMWVRLISYGKLHNLDAILLNYRIHSNQISITKKQKQIESAAHTRVELLNYLNHGCDEKELIALRKVLAFQPILDFQTIKLFESAKKKILISNLTNNFFSEEKLTAVLNKAESNMFMNYFVKRSSYKPVLFIEYLKLSTLYRLSFMNVLKLFTKSLIYYKT